MNIKKHIPNSITLCNLLCGCIAIKYAFADNLMTALLFIVLGALFDFFDGFAARKLGVSSPIGKELDSLADVITFGLAPATMVYSLLTAFTSIYASDAGIALGDSPLRLVRYAAFLIAAFSALRLANFNIDERQATSFIGLPTPANALLVASVTITFSNHPDWLAANSSGWSYSLAGIVILCALIILSCCLLVCSLPLFALKFKHFGWQGNKVRYIFLLSAVALLAWGAMCSLTRLVAIVGAVIVWYVILSLFTAKKKDNNERH
ncbi:MAG: CDP-diacylglycerol--serine O-phosphatidyltransferase [Bacteroidaceae bacterium]|nr:CDP-diacylglycerol--serine O-phosphatidyltransferase [Bacteroidaceae bacterium]